MPPRLHLLHCRTSCNGHGGPRCEVKQYKLAQRKLREIEELEKLKRSTLNEGQKEKIRRKPELLAQAPPRINTKTLADFFCASDLL